jgi:hypothetical protein
MATDETPPPDSLPGLPPELGQLVARAETGDERVMVELCALLDRHPVLWESVGDLANRAEVALLQHLAGRDLFVHETTRRKLAALREEFAPAGPLEGLLVGRLVLAWGEVSAAQLESFQLAASGAGWAAVAGFCRAASHTALLAQFLTSARQCATLSRASHTSTPSSPLAS